jgi:hypothetical protein
MPAYLHLNGIVGEISVIFQLMQFVEKKNQFTIAEILEAFSYGTRQPRFCSDWKMKDILNRFDLRLNVFLFLILNSFVCCGICAR